MDSRFIPGWRRLGWLLLIAAWFLQPGGSATRAVTDYVLLYTWGSEGIRMDISDLEVRSDGAILVADESQSRLTWIDQNERTFDTWSYEAESAAHLGSGLRSAIAPSGVVYIANSAKRIIYFTPQGAYMGQWGSEPTGEGEFGSIVDLAIDSNGFVYVLDSLKNRVHKFSRAGLYLRSWGSEGSGNDQFRSPSDIAVDADDQVFVVDQGNSRIMRFTADGAYQGQWGGPGTGAGLFSAPRAIATDPRGLVYVLDGDASCRVQRFSTSGLYQAEWNSCGAGLGASSSSVTIAVDSVGAVYIGDRDDDLVRKFGPDGQYWRQWGSARSAPENYGNDNPSAFFVDTSGNVYLTTRIGPPRVVKFDNMGTLVAWWESKSPFVSSFSGPDGVSADRTGKVYVADTYNDLVQIYEADGTYRSEFAVPYHPFGNSVDSNGNSFVLQYRNSGTVSKYASDGTLLGFYLVRNQTWSTAVQPDGRVLVAHGGGIVLLTNDLQYVADITSDPTTAVAVDSRGRFFAVQSNVIRVYDAGGARVAEISLQSESIDMMGVGVVADGRVYASTRDRVYVFGESYPSPDPDTGWIQNGDFSSGLAGWRSGGGPVSLVLPAGRTSLALEIGEPVPQVEQGESQVWALQTVYVDPSLARPMLRFSYNIVVNDIDDYSDFFVELQDQRGLRHLATVVREGYVDCAPAVPAAATALGWRTRSIDLSPWKGQSIRLIFSARNLWPISLGSWVQLDDVALFDAGPAPANQILIPTLLRTDAPHVTCP